MPFLDIFRNLFGIRYQDGPNPNYGPEIPRQENDKFRNPIWENDDDEDDVSDFRESNGGIHFQIFGDPFEMTRYFESQMDNMLKSMFDGFGQRGFMVPFDGEPKKSTSLRDRMLNREFESAEEFSRNQPKVDSDLDGKESNGGIHFQIFGEPFEMTRYFESQMGNMLKSMFDGFGQRGFMVPFDGEHTLEALPLPEPKKSTSLRDRILSREFESAEEFSRNQPKVDSDLDGKISSGELTKVWKDPSIQQVEPYNPRNSIASHFAGRCTSTQIIRRSDGTLEKRQTFRDSDGNEQITVTRQIGDKMHEIITKKDKAGVESKTENLINMDENELKTFDNAWKSGIVPNPPQDSTEGKNFPWHKIFGPEPKL